MYILPDARFDAYCLIWSQHRCCGVALCLPSRRCSAASAPAELDGLGDGADGHGGLVDHGLQHLRVHARDLVLFAHACAQVVT